MMRIPYYFLFISSFVLAATSACKKQSDLPVGMSAKVNNKKWVAKNYHGLDYILPGATNRSIHVIGNEPATSTDTVISFAYSYVDNIGGVYIISSFGNAGASYSDEKNYNVHHAISGTINVTKVSATNIQGTFNFVTDSFTVTDGVFNVPLQ
jgi:hypothetical protein